jgi:ABC-type bacteriocin/lantibiotic exporter with double-glycine peptidase domain
MVSACTGARAEFRQESYRNAVTVPVRFIKQRPGGCGIAALATILDYYGLEYPDIDGIYMDGIDGTRVISIVNYAARFGTAHVKRMGMEQIVERLRGHVPLIVLRKRHFYVVKGFIPDNGMLLVNDGYRENMFLKPPVKDDLIIYLERG